MTHAGAPQFPLRFPDEATRDRLKAEAKKNHRTMNAEILHRLEAYERQQGGRSLLSSYRAAPTATELPKLFWYGPRP